MMCLRKDNPRLDVIATHPLYDGVRAVFLFAYNFAKVTAAQLPVLIMASQSVNVFCKGLMGCSQGCSIINCRARGARLPLQRTGQSLQGADGHWLEKGVASATWLCPAQGLHLSEEYLSEEGRWAAPAREYVTGSTSQIPTFKVSPSWLLPYLSNIHSNLYFVCFIATQVHLLREHVQAGNAHYHWAALMESQHFSDTYYL